MRRCPHHVTMTHMCPHHTARLTEPVVDLKLLSLLRNAHRPLELYRALHREETRRDAKQRLSASRRAGKEKDQACRTKGQGESGRGRMRVGGAEQGRARAGRCQA